ncbi:DUF5681 domain-containing protein [Bradyrhizobium elkanii]|uniref:DUF5681 domain-containing protein n=1 Tax=Bradyrhizobium elkanii TaxID=29448 RepID=A0ABV4F0Q5_BRAEL|nr:DUF5681 domain-containing protein [Bradyrhizobium elkanii]MCP1758025.1 hypothetical protein [Bradyrhizobium elkanii]MCS3881678.1 hypothetical protein [Bradyrhizobium elkanii]MCS4218436.1 hypothetical protein [Bradyrhizobium elkanii]MCW2210349.1 hypothetical protein [Bradyrhizobium elkanii]OIM95063.1 hypothetical protein BLN97_07185 [Bradyrhizobium elkanii]
MTVTVTRDQEELGVKQQAVSTKWKPGQSGNPLGRPQGSRSKFSEAACADALADWTTHGKDTLARVRQDDPSTYLRVLFSIIPKDIAVSIEQRTGPLDSQEMRSMRRLVDLIHAAGATGLEPEMVFAWIEDDLRARLAKNIPDAGQVAETVG